MKITDVRAPAATRRALGYTAADVDLRETGNRQIRIVGIVGVAFFVALCIALASCTPEPVTTRTTCYVATGAATFGASPCTR